MKNSKMKNSKWMMKGILLMLLITVAHNFYLTIQLAQVKDLLYDTRDTTRNIDGLSTMTAENVSVIYDEIRSIREEINSAKSGAIEPFIE